MFSSDLFLLCAFSSPGVTSASNRNKYQGKLSLTTNQRFVTSQKSKNSTKYVNSIYRFRSYLRDRTLLFVSNVYVLILLFTEVYRHISKTRGQM